MRSLPLLILLCLLSAISRAELPRIEVSPDHQTFIRADTREVFHPWGFNYDRNDASRLLEECWKEKWSAVETDFHEMKKLGANIVRIHLQYASFMDAPDKPNESNLRQLAKLCDLANETGLYLDLTGLACYRKEKVPKWYDEMDDARRWAAQAHFWSVIAKTCADKPAIFDYDLVNEPAVPAEQRKPGDWLFGNLGGFWFCQFIALNGKDIDRNKMARDWTRKMSAAIREHDKAHLITIGMLPLPGAFPLEGAAPELDYISVHIYPEKGKVADALKTLKLFAVGKPLIIEETFPMSCSKEEENEFLLKSRPTAAGAIGFYWGKPPEELKKSRNIADAFTLAWLEIFQEINPNKP
jgi:hypothetical protein